VLTRSASLLRRLELFDEAEMRLTRTLSLGCRGMMLAGLMSRWIKQWVSFGQRSPSQDPHDLPGLAGANATILLGSRHEKLMHNRSSVVGSTVVEMGCGW